MGTTPKNTFWSSQVDELKCNQNYTIDDVHIKTYQNSYFPHLCTSGLLYRSSLGSVGSCQLKAVFQLRSSRLKQTKSDKRQK